MYDYVEFSFYCFLYVSDKQILYSLIVQNFHDYKCVPNPCVRIVKTALS